MTVDALYLNVPRNRLWLVVLEDVVFSDSGTIALAWTMESNHFPAHSGLRIYLAHVCMGLRSPFDAPIRPRHQSPVDIPGRPFRDS